MLFSGIMVWYEITGSSTRVVVVMVVTLVVLVVLVLLVMAGTFYSGVGR